MNVLHGISSLLLGYLFGCFQTSFFIAKRVSKKDIREMGSGNAGASNVTSEFGWSFGVLTGVIDVLKAFIPVKLVLVLFPHAYQETELMVLAGTGAILGHIFPFFLDFRGGKGIACYIGMLLAINWQLGVITILALMLITFITDFVAVGSLLLYTIIPILAFIEGSYSPLILSCLLILFGVGILKHLINIKRILNGSETGLRSVFKKHSTPVENSEDSADS